MTRSAQTVSTVPRHAVLEDRIEPEVQQGLDDIAGRVVGAALLALSSELQPALMHRAETMSSYVDATRLDMLEIFWGDERATNISNCSVAASDDTLQPASSVS